MAKIRTVKKAIAELKEYENNPRRNDKAVDAVCESIKKFGITNPIIINGDGVIIAGHTRILALKKIGVETVECIELTHLTEQQEKAFRIADNRVAEFSKWDKDGLISEMQNVEADDWKLFGFKDRDIKALEPPEQCTCPKCGRSFIKV